jgi:hypothetical protein
MADAVSYQLINKTGSQLNLVGTGQFPNSWLPAAPSTIASGATSNLDNNTGNWVPNTIVFGYSIEGESLTQFWVMSNGTNVVQFAPSGHSINVNVSGDSEDGWVVALTFQ